MFPAGRYEVNLMILLPGMTMAQVRRLLRVEPSLSEARGIPRQGDMRNVVTLTRAEQFH